MTAAETEGTPERWRYIGRRELTGGGLAHAWLDPAGRQLLYKGRGGAVGATYEVRVNRADGSVTMVGKPRFLRAAAADTTGDVPRWEAEDRAAYTSDELRKAEARAKRDGRFGDLTLNQARELIGRRPLQATALLAQIIRYVSAPAPPRR